MALKPISRIDGFRFPDDAWDVRGWTVRTDADDKKVGRVDDMLLDQAGGLRYLDVDLGFLKKHVLVPLERAHAESETETVWIEALTRDELEDVPEYALDPELLDDSYERRIDAVYGGTSVSAHTRLVAPEDDTDGDLELERMAELEGEYQVGGDDPRGWKVITADGTPVGRVSELLMEPARMKARFLDVVVDEKALDLEPVDRHVLLPVERVRLDRTKKAVLVSGLLAHDFATFPQYGGLPLSRTVVRELNEVFERASSSASSSDGARSAAPPSTADEPMLRTAATARAEAGHAEPDWRQRTLRHFYRERERNARPVAGEE